MHSKFVLEAMESHFGLWKKLVSLLLQSWLLARKTVNGLYIIGEL
jgi:hypothetical protein